MATLNTSFSDSLQVTEEYKHVFSKKDFAKGLRSIENGLRLYSNKPGYDKISITFKVNEEYLLNCLLGGIITLYYFKQMHKKMESLKIKYM